MSEYRALNWFTRVAEELDAREAATAPAPVVALDFESRLAFDKNWHSKSREIIRKIVGRIFRGPQGKHVKSARSSVWSLGSFLKNDAIGAWSDIVNQLVDQAEEATRVNEDSHGRHRLLV
jgi:hypothetical protein